MATTVAPSRGVPTDGGGWIVPRQPGTNTPITSGEIATNMHLNFNYQVDSSGNPRPVEEFERFVAAVQARHAWLDAALARRLAHAYGARVADLLGDAASPADLGVEVAPGLYERELRFMQAHEWVRVGDDALWRRSKLGLRYSAEQRAAVDAWLRDHPI